MTSPIFVAWWKTNENFSPQISESKKEPFPRRTCHFLGVIMKPVCGCGECFFFRVNSWKLQISRIWEIIGEAWNMLNIFSLHCFSVWMWFKFCYMCLWWLKWKAESSILDKRWPVGHTHAWLLLGCVFGGEDTGERIKHSIHLSCAYVSTLQVLGKRVLYFSHYHRPCLEG